MKGEDAREQAVLSEFDMIPMGNHKQVTTYPWLYGQVRY